MFMLLWNTLKMRRVIANKPNLADQLFPPSVIPDWSSQTNHQGTKSGYNYAMNFKLSGRAVVVAQPEQSSGCGIESCWALVSFYPSCNESISRCHMEVQYQ